jgi:hypothetical protein
MSRHCCYDYHLSPQRSHLCLAVDHIHTRIPPCLSWPVMCQTPMIVSAPSQPEPRAFTQALNGAC